MAENVLQIKTNGKYKNIDLLEMDSGDSILLTKKYATSLKKEFSKQYDGQTRTWDGFIINGTYNGEEVSCFAPKYNSKDGLMGAEKFAALYDNAGGEGDTIKITCTKGMGKVYDRKTKKQIDGVIVDYTVEVM